MNVCFVCYTPFHVLNMVNYVFNHQARDVFFDAYLNTAIPGVDGIAQRLEAEHITNRIYRFDSTPRDTDSWFFNRLHSVAMHCYPRAYLKKRITPWEGTRAYHQIFVPHLLEICHLLVNASPKADLFYYDEGYASYIGAFPEFGFSSLKLWAFRFLSGRKTSLLPETMYLNNPSFCIFQKYKNVLPLPGIPDRNAPVLAVLRRVFDYCPPEAYARKRCVILDQPAAELVSRDDGTTRRIWELFDRHAERYLVRPHPRQSAECYSGYCTDRSRACWELLCTDTITPEHTLISVFSTAQLIPKMILDQEPRLIFLYKLYGDSLKSSHLASFNNTCRQLREKYRDKSKVIVVESLRELEEILDQIPS